MTRALLMAVASFVIGVGLVSSVVLSNRTAGRPTSTPEASPASAAPDPETAPGANEPPDPIETTGYAEAGPAESDSTRIEIELTGYRDSWQVRYPGTRGSAEAHSGLAVIVPEESAVRLRLTSRDFVYLLSLPRIHQSQVAVPGREFTLDFRSRSPGVFLLQGEHVCGPPKSTLTLTVHVRPKAVFDAWSTNQARATTHHEGKDR